MGAAIYKEAISVLKKPTRKHAALDQEGTQKTVADSLRKIPSSRIYDNECSTDYLEFLNLKSLTLCP